MIKSKAKDNRNSPIMPLKNRFQPLETINNDLDSVNDNVSVNSSDLDNSIEHNEKKRVQKSRSFRKYKSYAHCLSTGDLVSENPTNLNLFREKPKQNSNINLNKSNNENNTIPNSNVHKNKTLADCFINDFRDSFLYQLLIKIRTFYNMPNKSGFQWVSFLIDLFDFVGQYTEEDQ